MLFMAICLILLSNCNQSAEMVEKTVKGKVITIYKCDNSTVSCLIDTSGDAKPDIDAYDRNSGKELCVGDSVIVQLTHKYASAI